VKRVLKKPVISEKAVALAESGKYVFLGDNLASKPEVAKAVEELFKVKVVKVNSFKIAGKEKTFRRIKGRQQSKHKFVVTLKKGDKIELFEGAK